MMMTVSENLPKPDCHLGYTYRQIASILGPESSQETFWYWMRGQTMAVCDGADCSAEHGMPIVYRNDLLRYLAGLPITD